MSFHINGMVTDATRIIPGHGALSSKAQLRAYRDMLATVSGRVRTRLAGGSKLEEIAATASVTADFDAQWGKGFIPPPKFRETVAADLMRRGK